MPKVIRTITIDHRDVKGKTKVLYRMRPPARGKACLLKDSSRSLYYLPVCPFRHRVGGRSVGRA
eukprot:1108336-Heterocapsa_arctica.AAC.1